MGMRTTLKLIALFTILAITACSKLDVVGNDSVRAFNDLLQSAPQLVKEDEENNGWAIDAPDGNARFIWSKNFAESSVFDIQLQFYAAPFIDAGLDPAPFIAAGTDPAKIEGWTFAKVTVDDANGKPVQVDKILKSFNLK